MKKIFFITTLLILFVSAAHAQTTEKQNWTRLESDAKDFSIAVPSNYEVLFDREGQEIFYGRGLNNLKKVKISDVRFVTAFTENASFLVESYKTSNLRDAMASLSPGGPTVNEYVDFGFNGFEGKTFTRSSDNSYSLEIIIGQKDRLYRILGGAKDKNNEALKYFLSSLKLNNKNSLVLKSLLDGQVKETSVLISSLKETPFQFEKDETEQKKERDEPVKPLQEEGKKSLLILYKPKPPYTEAGRRTRTTGTVRLRVTFSENGNIAKISVLSGLGNGLTENAVRAARLIRFLPMEIDNKPVATTKTVVYSFDIY